MLATQLNMDMRQFNRLHIVHNAFLTALPVEGGGWNAGLECAAPEFVGLENAAGTFYPSFSGPVFAALWSLLVLHFSILHFQSPDL